MQRVFDVALWLVWPSFFPEYVSWCLYLVPSLLSSQ